MPSAVWCEWWPLPTVPVPMARRVVWMPVRPRETVSAAENFCDSAGMARRLWASGVETNQAPATAREVRWRNSRRRILSMKASVWAGAEALSYYDAPRRELVIRGGEGSQVPVIQWAKEIQAAVPPMYMRRGTETAKKSAAQT